MSHASMLVWEGLPVLPPATRRSRPDPILPPAHFTMPALLALMKARGTLFDATLFVAGEAGPETNWSAAIS